MLIGVALLIDIRSTPAAVNTLAVQGPPQAMFVIVPAPFSPIPVVVPEGNGTLVGYAVTVMIFS